MMEAKGIVKTKREFLFSHNCVGDVEKFKGKLLKVIDIAVDDSGYMCLNCDGTALGTIDKRDTHVFTAIENDLMKTLKEAFGMARKV